MMLKTLGLSLLYRGIQILLNKRVLAAISTAVAMQMDSDASGDDKHRTAKDAALIVMEEVGAQSSGTLLDVAIKVILLRIKGR